VSPDSRSLYFVEAHAALERAFRQIENLERQLAQATNALNLANSPVARDSEQLGDVCRFYAAKLKTLSDTLVRGAP
jgi:hypothetical protein